VLPHRPAVRGARAVRRVRALLGQPWRCRGVRAVPRARAAAGHRRAHGALAREYPLERAGRRRGAQVARLHPGVRTLARRHGVADPRRAAPAAAAHRDAEAAHGGGAPPSRRRSGGADHREGDRLRHATGRADRCGARDQPGVRRRGHRDPRLRRRGGVAAVTPNPGDRDDRLSPLAALRLLRPIQALHPLAIALVVLLGALASAAEGIGIALFIPLVEGIAPGASAGGLPAPLAPLVGWIPADRRSVVLPLLMLRAVVLKNVLVFANHAIVSRLFADTGT